MMHCFVHCPLLAQTIWSDVSLSYNMTSTCALPKSSPLDGTWVHVTHARLYTVFPSSPPSASHQKRRLENLEQLCFALRGRVENLEEATDSVIGRSATAKRISTLERQVFARSYTSAIFLVLKARVHVGCFHCIACGNPSVA